MSTGNMDTLKKVFGEASTSVEMLPADSEAAERNAARYSLDDSTLLGALILGTGGVVVDKWLRLYGSGTYDFAERNDALAEFAFPIIAEDIAGGLFAIGEDRQVAYLAPDTLQWENLEISLGQFIMVCTDAEALGGFYQDFRWEGWQEFIKDITPAQGLSFYPPLWSRESKDGFSAKLIPIDEVFSIELEYMKTLG